MSKVQTSLCAAVTTSLVAYLKWVHCILARHNAWQAVALATFVYVVGASVTAEAEEAESVAKQPGMRNRM